jgi:hypothetical protein
MKNFGDAMNKIKALEGHKPMTLAEINTTVDGIKNQYGIPGINVIPKGNDKWKITGSLAGKKNKQSVYVPANMQPGDEKEKKGPEKAKEKELVAGLKYLADVNDKKAEDGIMDMDEVAMVAKTVQAEKKDVFKSITVMDAGDRWKYHYIQRAEGEANAAKKPAGYTYPPDFVEGAYLDYKDTGRILKITQFYPKEDLVKTVDIVSGRETTFKPYTALTKGILKVNHDPVPPQRFFPASWPAGRKSIRPWLYINMNNWEAAKKIALADGKKGKQIQIDKILEVQRTKNMTLWDQYIDDMIVNKLDEHKKPVDINTYDPNNVEYDVDHITPLSVYWNQKGNNTTDEERSEHVVGQSNLRVITAQHNRGRPFEVYKMFVLKDFRSSKAENNSPGAKTIQATSTRPVEPFR